MVSLHVDMNKGLVCRRAHTQCFLEGPSRRVQEPRFLESNYSMRGLGNAKHLRGHIQNVI